MPQLDEMGHVPEELLYSEDGPSWKQAAIDCGVDADHVEARAWASEKVAAIQEELTAVTERYMSTLCKELELMPWGDREMITSDAAEVSHVFGAFMVAAEEARALIVRGGR